MELSNYSFNNFIHNSFVTSRFVFVIILYLFFSLAFYSWSNNIFLYMLFLSSFYLFALFVILILAIRGDNPSCFEKWNNPAKRNEFMKEKFHLMYILFSLVVLSDVIFFFILQFVKYQPVTPDLLTTFLICLILLSYLLLGKSYIYWLVESLTITGYNQETKLIKLQMFPARKLVGLFVYCVPVMAFMNILISNYFEKQQVITSGSIITGLLIVELVILYVSYILITRKSKERFEKRGEIVNFAD